MHVLFSSLRRSHRAQNIQCLPVSAELRLSADFLWTTREYHNENSGWACTHTDNCCAARWLLLSIFLARIVPAEAILLGAFYSSPSFISLLCCPHVLNTSLPQRWHNSSNLGIVNRYSYCLFMKWGIGIGKWFIFHSFYDSFDYNRNSQDSESESCHL